MPSRGKQYENCVKENWRRTFPRGFLYRIRDQVSGLKGSTNISDFIGYVSGILFLIECKSHQGNTFPLVNLTQYNNLLAYQSIPGIRMGVFLWMIDHGVEVYIPISTITAMKKDGIKSFNIKMLQKQDYRIFVFPSKRKRVFLESDYSLLINSLQEGD